MQRLTGRTPAKSACISNSPGQSQRMPRSTAKSIVPKEEECWPVLMLLDIYPELRFERWLPSRLRTITKSNGDVYDERLLRGPNEKPLCLWCSRETKGAGSLFCSPPPSLSSSSLTLQQTLGASASSTAESSFGEGCEHEHRMRRDGQYVRRQLFLRDRGVCAGCGVDTHELFTRALDCQSLSERGKFIKQLTKMNPEWDKKMRKPLSSIDYEFTEGQFWEAAHKIDIKHGGGLCGLDGFQTLCVPCHTEEYMRNYAEEVRNLRGCQSPSSIYSGKEVAITQSIGNTRNRPAPVLANRNPNAALTKTSRNPIAANSKYPNTLVEATSAPALSYLPRLSASGSSTSRDSNSASSMSSISSYLSPRTRLCGPETSTKQPLSVACRLQTSTSLRSSSRRLAPIPPATIDLTSPSERSILSTSNEEMIRLTSKLTTINISSDEQSSDELEVLDIARPKKVQQHLRFPKKSKRSQIADSICSTIVDTTPVSTPRKPPRSRTCSSQQACA
ncbi:hypothetical protein GGI25_001541 [Coemansia spiralis]|uniref:Uncharacterized protein n=2 Tax=Coemansia TaxID=4863 RepID=A0A9W8GCJ4_9FUNG|nr:hypothetical protein EDC05_002044 [Coemansia umbellata]KAJ2622982.1 hypothetical protein GGI26_002783 [Coemansia sp. RSA 1358]KAJ2679406.1 hypothetical protein GGI25_001541 [Coemansia spiralis]